MRDETADTGKEEHTAWRRDASQPTSPEAETASGDEGIKMPKAFEFLPPTDHEGEEIDRLEEQLAAGMEGKLSENEAASGSSQEGKSYRLLESERKRAICTEMRDGIRNGSNMLVGILRQADVLTDYLAKAESELKRLEGVEAQSEKLRQTGEALARKTQEMKSTIADQRKTITLLEVKLNTLREANDSAKGRITRLQEEQRVAAVEKASAEGKRAQLENDRQSLMEQVQLLQSERDQAVDDLTKARTREEKLVADNRQKDIDLKSRNEETAELRETRKSLSIELDEMRTRNESLRAELIEQKSLSEQLSSDLESSRREWDEVLRLKTKRIAELESRDHVAQIDVPSLIFEPAPTDEERSAQFATDEMATSASSERASQDETSSSKSDKSKSASGKQKAA